MLILRSLFFYSRGLEQNGMALFLHFEHISFFNLSLPLIQPLSEAITGVVTNVIPYQLPAFHEYCQSAVWSQTSCVFLSLSLEKKKLIQVTKKKYFNLFCQTVLKWQDVLHFDQGPHCSC